MQNQSALLTGASVTGSFVGETIKSRFGDIIVDVNRAVAFPRGLLGMPDKSKFVLVNFPSEKMQQFTLLQSLQESPLSFITLPIDLDNPIVATADLRHAASELHIAEENLVVLLIVSVHRHPDQVRLSVNARAPLLVDAQRKVGVQYVFHTDAYKVQHML
jgi:flagellar assembly factor FliW